MHRAGSIVFLGLLKRGLHTYLARWFSYIESLTSVQAAVAAFQSAQKTKVRHRSGSYLQTTLPDFALIGSTSRDST